MSFKQAKKDNKLSPKYYGPYKDFQNIGTMAYKLELPASSWVHPVFHVSCLKKVIGENLPIQTILPKLEEEGKIILEPEAVTETRTRQLQNRSISEYLIKWKNLPTKILNGRMKILYKSTRSYSSIEENNFLKERGMVGPYITSVVPYYCYCSALIVIVVPL